MRKADFLQHRWQSALLLLTVLLVVAADQLTKTWVRSYPEGQDMFQAGFFRLVHVQNTGAVFGLFQGQSFTLTIVAIVGIVILLLLVFLARRPFPLLSSPPGLIAFSLMLGGTVGNLIDRLRLGHVTDFIDVRVWPAFNVADSATVVGAVVLAYLLIRLSVKGKRGSAS